MMSHINYFTHFPVITNVYWLVRFNALLSIDITHAIGLVTIRTGERQDGMGAAAISERKDWLLLQWATWNVSDGGLCCSGCPRQTAPLCLPCVGGLVPLSGTGGGGLGKD